MGQHTLPTRAEDRAAITAVVHRYAHTAREKMNFDDMLHLFEPTAFLVLPDGTSVGPAELSEVLQGEEARYIRHHITTVDMQFDGDDLAHSETFFLAITNEAAPDHWGHWRDVFAKRADGTWLIRERVIVVEGGAPDGWFSRMYLQKS